MEQSNFTFAKLELAGALVNGIFVPVPQLYEKIYSDTDVIEPLFKNILDKKKAVGRIKIKAVRHFIDSFTSKL